MKELNYFNFIWLSKTNSLDLDFLCRLSLISKRYVYPNKNLILYTNASEIGYETAKLIHKLNIIVKLKSLPNPDQINELTWNTDKGLAFKADFLRVNLLKEVGGWYFDLDSISIKPIHLKDNVEYSTCLEPDRCNLIPSYPHLGIFFTKPNSTYINRYIELRNNKLYSNLSNMELGSKLISVIETTGEIHTWIEFLGINWFSLDEFLRSHLHIPVDCCELHLFGQLMRFNYPKFISGDLFDIHNMYLKDYLLKLIDWYNEID